ncbi:hypothetical protein GF314_15610, partial [bacterium]|nr:hypothetical protein [bacterium]
MIRRLRMPVLALSATALLASTTAATVATVENPAEAPTHETWTLREAWRVGADEADVLLGQIAVLRGGPDGEVYALDSQLAEIQVFGPGGEFRRTLGREGEGPGEFRQPTNLFWTDDGRIAV